MITGLGVDRGSAGGGGQCLDGSRWQTMEAFTKVRTSSDRSYA